MDEFTCNHFWKWAVNHFNGDVDAACRMFEKVSRAVKNDPSILNLGWPVLARGLE